MVYIKRTFLYHLFFVSWLAGILMLGSAQINTCQAQGTTCSQASCLSASVSFPALLNGGPTTTSDLSNCLESTFNESWFYFEVTIPGTVVQSVSISPSSDIDYAVWGPFPSLAAA